LYTYDYTAVMMTRTATSKRDMTDLPQPLHGCDKEDDNCEGYD